MTTTYAELLAEAMIALAGDNAAAVEASTSNLKTAPNFCNDCPDARIVRDVTALSSYAALVYFARDHAADNSLPSRDDWSAALLALEQGLEKHLEALLGTSATVAVEA